MTVSLSPLKPKDALAYFRQKGLRTSFAYQDVWQDEHAKAFTVAKAMSMDILTDIRDALDTAMAEGKTFEQFRKELAPILQAKGWWGRKEMVDPLTGEKKLVQLGSDRRLRVIFNTNMRTAYNVGNWQRSWATRASFPYLIYHHADGLRFPRPEHQAWDGVCLPIEHPFWKTHYPQCAWGCKCSTESVSKQMLIDRKLSVTKDADIARFPMKEYVNPRTGEVSQVEQGIDPAWNYNPGQSPLKGLTPRPAPPTPGAPPPAVPPQPPADLAKPSTTPAPATKPAETAAPAAEVQPAAKPIETAVDGFLKVFDAAAQDKIVTDRTGWPLPIGRDLFTTTDGRLRSPQSALVPWLPVVGRALKEYDQVAWHWRPPAVPSFQPAEIRAVLDDAQRGVDSRLVARFGKVQDWLVKVAKEHGQALQDFDYSLPASEARHILLRHGDAVLEAGRKQVAVTPADIEGLPDLVTRASHVIFGRVTNKGLPAVIFITQKADLVYLVVMEVRARRWQLAAKTMRKYPAIADVNRAIGSVGPNVLNGGGADDGIVDIAALGKAVTKLPREELVRRYSKRLDKFLITVDFARDTWTYDVQPAKAPLKRP